MEEPVYYVCKHCRKTKKALPKNIQKRQDECEMRTKTLFEIDRDGDVSSKIAASLASFRAAHGIKSPGETSGVKNETSGDAISVEAEKGDEVHDVEAEKGDEVNDVEAGLKQV